MEAGRLACVRWPLYGVLRPLHGLLCAGWYWDMGRTSKRRETALKTIDGEAPYKPARNAGNVPGSSALASRLIPSALLRRLAGCWLFVRFLVYAEQTRQNGNKPRRNTPADPVRPPWGMVYILNAFHFCQKGKVHLLNIQTAICYRNCHRRRFLKRDKSIQLRI